MTGQLPNFPFPCHRLPAVGVPFCRAAVTVLERRREWDLAGFSRGSRLREARYPVQTEELYARIVLLYLATALVASFYVGWIVWIPVVAAIIAVGMVARQMP